MSHAIYQFIENNEIQYAYSHFGGNLATGPIRYTEAQEIAQEQSTNITKAILNLTYEGIYDPSENNGNKVFNRIESSEKIQEILSDYEKTALIHAKVTINMDRNIYKFENPENNFTLPLSEVTKVTRQQMQNWDKQKSVWNIYDFSKKLETKFKELKKQYKYTMDVVVVEPGLPARHVQLDTSYGKLYAMQQAVQGLIEPIYSLAEPGMMVYANEEGRITEMPPNRRIPNEQPVCGTFIICGDKDGADISLSERQITKYMGKYKVPEKFTDAEIAKAHECQMCFLPFQDEKSINVIDQTKSSPTKGKGR